MKHKNDQGLNEREIMALLKPRRRPVPPADLAERIKQEIPADLPVIAGTGDDDGARAGHRISRSRVWLMAASVVVAVGGGLFAVRLMNQMPASGEAPVRAAAVDATVAEQESVSFRSPPTSGETSAGKTLTGKTSAKGTETPSPAISATGRSATMPAGAAASIAAKDSTARPGDSLSEHLGEEANTDLDSTFGKQQRLLDKADGRLNEGREKTHGDGERGMAARSELGRRLDTPPPAAPRPMAQSTQSTRPTQQARPARPARRSEAIEADDEAPVVETMTFPDTGILSDEFAEAKPRKQKAVAPKERRDRRHTAPGNQQIEYGNAKISDMRKEARELEAELKTLEELPPASAPAAPPPPPSTGGTAEPNDAPYGDVFFAGAGTNPFVDTEDDALSTFGLDVDTGSYTVIRRYLRDGHLPPPEAVRVEELINYFDYGDAAPRREEFAIHAEGAPSIYGQGERYYLLRVNLSGRELDEVDRRPALLTFVVDVSGSMGRENRLGLVKQALALLIDQLRADDLLALVVYGSRGQVVLRPTADHGAMRRAIDQLHTGGSTNAEQGLELAYELAARYRRRGAINRVILCSDGVANVGATSAGSILERIRHEADQGIELTTVGFGMGNYNDVLMERLADTGNGRYAYVDTLDEARRIFVENLTGTLQTLAAEARVQVELNPAVVSRYRLLGYENRDIADQRFRDDTVDAGEIGVGHKVTALYEIKLHDQLRDRNRIGTVRLRWGSIEQGRMLEAERVVTGADFVRRWQTASPALKLTSLVAEYAEILKRSYWAREGDLDDVFRRAQRLSAGFEGDRDVADFVSLVGRAAEYREREPRR